MSAKATDLPMDGKSLAALRKSLGYSQDEFGKILGLSRASIAGAEKIIRLSLDQALRDGKLREKKKWAKTSESNDAAAAAKNRCEALIAALASSRLG
jgi:transcriptional regulator with XRE-family HTH domain